MLSITTDYKADTGDPYPYLVQIAKAGFTHIHWCHEWNTETLYSAADISKIAGWLSELGLALLDLHASEGRESLWISAIAVRRNAGIALVANRMETTAALGSDVIVLHIPNFDGSNPDDWFSEACRSLDALRSVSSQTGVRIALENLGNNNNWERLRQLFAHYPSEFIGLCYDSGHGNFNAPSVNNLEQLKHRLIALHLHDNNGLGDQHLVPFYGTANWQAITKSIATSSYTKCISMESGIKNHIGWDNERFLCEAFAAGERLTKMVESMR